MKSYAFKNIFNCLSLGVNTNKIVKTEIFIVDFRFWTLDFGF
jgi:hypothetical protein